MSAQELYELAMKHIYGDGVPEDNELAVKLLTQAHEMDHVEATYNLGICYHYGYGTVVDLAKAYELYLESANGGYGKGYKADRQHDGQGSGEEAFLRRIGQKAQQRDQHQSAACAEETCHRAGRGSRYNKSKNRMLLHKNTCFHMVDGR